MRRTIRNNAGLERIEDHLQQTVTVGLTKDAPVETWTREQLVPALDAIVASRKEWQTAALGHSAARDALLTEDARCRVLVCGIRDAIWTALGRVQHNPFMPFIFPDGVDPYTRGDRSDRPDELARLQAQIADCPASRLTAAQRTDWIADLEAARIAMTAALDAHKPAAEKASRAKVDHRTAVQLGQKALAFFKRHLEHDGLTQAKIFEIIPNAAPSGGRARKARVMVSPDSETDKAEAV